MVVKTKVTALEVFIVASQQIKRYSGESGSVAVTSARNEHLGITTLNL